jgi:hypothetical protein
MRKVVFRSIGLALLLATSGIALACDNDGPVEDAMEDVGDEAEDAAEDVEDAID